MLFVQEDIPAKLIGSKKPSIEGLLCRNESKKAKAVDKLFL